MTLKPRTPRWPAGMPLCRPTGNGLWEIRMLPLCSDVYTRICILEWWIRMQGPFAGSALPAGT